MCGRQWFKWAKRIVNWVCLWGVSQFDSVGVKNDRWDSFLHIQVPNSFKHLFNNSLFTLGQWWQQTSSQWGDVSLKLSGSMEEHRGTLLNQPCNSSHRIKRNIPQTSGRVTLWAWNEWNTISVSLWSGLFQGQEEARRGKIVDYWADGLSSQIWFTYISLCRRSQTMMQF